MGKEGEFEVDIKIGDCSLDSSFDFVVSCLKPCAGDSFALLSISRLEKKERMKNWKRIVVYEYNNCSMGISALSLSSESIEVSIIKKEKELFWKCKFFILWNSKKDERFNKTTKR